MSLAPFSISSDSIDHSFGPASCVLRGSVSYNPGSFEVIIALAEYRSRYMITIAKMRRYSSYKAIVIRRSNANAALAVFLPFYIFVAVVLPKIILSCWDDLNLSGAGKGARY